ncbi:MAG: sugar kinase [Fulvimarina manganoxydans]|uniref:sugar kinase n=1 Tax=Fulvimarina manganoxydans TaxID=937218 RepID=UPI0023562B0B|nr:sugar kinase [Fulvimarina manganoxydans]MCK5931914.1 sugar kinase [Fulvimarina manganoxydans]
MRILSIGECMIEMSGGAGGAWHLGFAGDTLNTLWYARASLDPAEGSVAYFTALGDDGFSDKIEDFLGTNGIDTSQIVRIEGRRPGLYMIEQIAGDRHFTYWRETSAARRLAEDETRLSAAIEAAELVYLSGITLAILPAEHRERLIALCGTAKARGQIVAFDPNIRPALWTRLDEAREAIMAMAGSASIVLPSFDDEHATFEDDGPGATIARYAGAGVKEIAVKDGPRAIHVFADGKTEQVEAVPDVEVVDATGAGDSFNGAYLGARLSGADPLKAAAAGRDMAAQVVGVRGALADWPLFERWARKG